MERVDNTQFVDTSILKVSGGEASMKKIVLIGCGGAGKSTLARQMGERLKIRVHHLDTLHWKPNWEMTAREEQEAIQRALTEEEEWIMDGHYGSTLPIRLKACDTIVFLDMPRTLCIYRAIKRFLTYRNKTRPDMREGCEEKLDLPFLKWIWDFPKHKKPQVLEEVRRYSEGKRVLILRSRKEVQQFVSQL